MKGQDISVTKKRGRPRSEPTSVIRLPHSILAQLDLWIAGQAAALSRPEAIGRLLALALGKIDNAGSIAAEDLNASNDE